MALFKLKSNSKNLDDCELLETSAVDIDLEAKLENWLEKSPWALLQGPILIIHRQMTGSLNGSIVKPDLLGLDGEGNLVVIEVKKGITPRETIAQVLEYAAWGNSLSSNEIELMSKAYFEHRKDISWSSLEEAYSDFFELDELPPLNKKIKLMIVGEEIHPKNISVAEFLRDNYQLDLECLSYRLYQTESGESLVSCEKVVGIEDSVCVINEDENNSRWSGDKLVKDVVYDAVVEYTNNDPSVIFTLKEIIDHIKKTIPGFKASTTRCQIFAHCKDHPSKKHYSGKHDYFSRVEKGKYKLLKKKAGEIAV